MDNKQKINNFPQQAIQPSVTENSNNETNQQLIEVSEIQSENKVQGANTKKLNPKSSKTVFWLSIWNLPLVITIGLFILSQILISGACMSLPEESRGECAAGWFNLVLIPLFIFFLLVSSIISIIGAIIVTKRSKDAEPNIANISTTDNSKLDALGLVGLILSVFISPIGLFLCVLSIVRSKKRGQKSSLFAVIGVVLSAVCMVVPLVWFLLMFRSALNTT